MKKILITGGTGFVASHLVEALYQKGERNIHLTAYRDEGSFVKQFINSEQIHQINLTDYQATQNLIAQVQPDEIYHLASIANVGDSFEKRKTILDMNTNLQLNLLEAMKNHAPHSKMLHVSTALVYEAKNQAVG
jgi:nucleoside-diphosphate-sugar epimerase